MRDKVAQLVAEALTAAVEADEIALDPIPTVEVERPRDPAHGDWATNVALKSAKAAGMQPRVLAEAIAARMAAHPDIDGTPEVAGPGFINLRLSPAALQRVVTDVRSAGAAFGRVDLGGGKRVQVEFVSANPVGPMHVGHGRWAALGDSMARVLEHAGWQVQREFYVNDSGVQMDIFGASVAARYLEACGREAAFPEEGYRGAYIAEVAAEIREQEGDALAGLPLPELAVRCRELGYALVLENHLKRVLHGMGVDFDVWFSERTLHAPGANGGPSEIEQAIARLRELGHIFEHEGAIWFRSTGFGDDKDRVLRKSDGEYTYFAADVAYHWDKFDVRGFDRVIDIWGADHHGYVARMKAAAAALGHPGKLDLVIGQLVNLYRDGEAVRMSKRTGEMVTFEELLDEVGADAARYWFLRRSTDQQVDFDIGVAKEQSAENPVYYVQYAHARICSILRKAAGADTADETVDIAAVAPAGADLSLLAEDAELTLLRKLAELSEVVELAARDLAPHKLTRFAEDLAATFHQFYTVCKVVQPGQPDLTAARLALVDATRIVLATTLGLLGVSAPERM
ncbi:MAG: arginine--tRNA ligase [Coriobacteriaceae bacterium]|nr:arginine--tRNA ligase [Coriobacteriaceae bacterium]